MSAFEESIIQRIRSLEREVERLQRWERPIVITDHGALAGLGDDDHPQYLLTTGKAADSDKLDGNDSTYFAAAAHTHLINLPIGSFNLIGGASLSTPVDGSTISLPDTGVPILDTTCPIIYAGKSLRLKLLVMSTETGNISLGFEIRKLSSGASYPSPATLSTSLTIGITTANSLVEGVSSTLNTSSYSQGDYLGIRIYRLVSDANTGTVHIAGIYLEAV